MQQVVWKNELAALWVFQILNFIAVLLMTNAPPAASKFDSAMANAAKNATVAIAFYFFLTCLLIWLTLILKPSVNRWPTIVLGLFFVFVKGYWLITSLSGSFPKGCCLQKVGDLLPRF